MMRSWSLAILVRAMCARSRGVHPSNTRLALICAPEAIGALPPVTMLTLAIGALGSDSAGATEMILTVGAGLPLGTFGFAVTRITEGRLHSSELISEKGTR
jgi:hypothetical protein